jgi:cysteinyl-tRNA synthetase
MKLLLPTILLNLLVSVSCTTSLKHKLKSVESWGYQLQNYNKGNPLAMLKVSPERLWVIDPELDGAVISKEEKRRVINESYLPIAYLSIGEAEDYRSYFKSLNKDILQGENPHWKGNFKVKYWEEEWQQIILKRVDDIVELGFKGVYLDIVDAFYYQKDKVIAADRMVSFIEKIKIRALSKCAEFLVIQQNAPTLYEYTTRPEVLFSNVDALALEDAFFFGNKDHDNPFIPQDYALKAANLYIKKGLRVLNVEYLKDRKAIEKYAKEVKDHLILPLVANRKLSGPLRFSEEL